MKKSDILPTLGIIADRIKTFRKLRGLTQEQLADKSALSLNYVGVLEICGKTPSLDALLRIAKALDVPISDLLSTDRKSSMVNQMSSLMDTLEETDVEFLMNELADWARYLEAVRKHSS